MDFLDPKKRRNHKIRLITGYVLIAVAIGLATTILLYQTYGYNLDKNGRIIQNGLVFVSSRPNPADIYVNGQRAKNQTNSRMQLPAGAYTLRLQRTGYRPWQREMTVVGGDVQHFDYPLLLPSKLVTNAIATYADAPQVLSQSPDGHWLVVQSAANVGEFGLYNLTKPKDPPTTLDLPADVLTTSDGAQSWQVLEWANDNRHLLLKHSYQKGGQAPNSEYILLDRQAPLESVNLNKAFNLNGIALSLRNKAFDQYFFFNPTSGTLTLGTLNTPTPTPYLEHVLEFKPYGANTVLYVTNQEAPAGQVLIKLRQDATSYTVRQLPASSTYLLDLARYSGDLYLAVGTPNEPKIYLYKNPLATLQKTPTGPATALRVLAVPHPSFVRFSDNGEFVLAEDGTRFAVYDAEVDRGYSYQLDMPIDEPQAHANWIDVQHLSFVSNGKAVLMDYDGINVQTLMAADPRFASVIAPGAKAFYTVAAQQMPATADKSASDGFALTSTALLVPADQ